MYALSWAIRSKPEWQSKISDPSILEKYRKGALDQQEGLRAEQKLTENMVNYVLNELAGYSQLADPTSGIECGPFDAIWYSDRLISNEVSDSLRAAVSKLEDVPDDLKGWLPGLNNQVLDLQGELPGACWLPSDFSVHATDDSLKLVSPYINNLHPTKHKALYAVIESVLSSFVPLFERFPSQVNGQDKDLYRDVTPGSGRIKTEACDGTWAGFNSKYMGITVPCIWSNGGVEWEEGMTDEEYDKLRIEAPKVLPEAFEEYTPGELEESIAPYSLRGKTIQCIIKLPNIHLTPENPKYEGGSWHVEAILNERIVASGIYYYEEENISESHLAFRVTTGDPVYHEQWDEMCIDILYGLKKPTQTYTQFAKDCVGPGKSAFDFAAFSTPGHLSPVSGMFSGSHHLSVTGTTLTNITNYIAAPAVTSSFRMIPLGDIDLQHEICLDNATCVADWRRLPRVRRVYSARVEGQSTTVAMYQGHGAEEQWRQDIAKYIHPNIVQIRGAASADGIHATLFHDDIFVDLHQHSHFMTVYIWAYSGVEFQGACNYFFSIFQQKLVGSVICRPDLRVKKLQDCEDCTLWIRSSTGRLCTELIEPINATYLYVSSETCRLEPSTEVMIIESLTLQDYHDICYYNLRRFPSITISTRTAVNLGAVAFCPSSNRLEDSVEIASLPNAEVSYNWGSVEAGEVIEEGWTRDVFDSTLRLHLWLRNGRSWLSQANYIFSCLQITSQFQDYRKSSFHLVLVDDIYFELTIPAPKGDPPVGFLFLCPEQEFHVGPSAFCWPVYPAYWSLDPLGVERLSAEDAAQLGFPTIHLTTAISGNSWDNTVYGGLRQFHHAKVFDPDSLHIAWHLGQPLFRVSNKIGVTRVEEEYYYSEEDEFSMDLC
ncbi:hypothetical protein B0H19DRAFT_1267451 [Mycena capillaripes]|nr:hypothetical protein B0H19DRAFT_1267451 [Mycena capillaripes]